MGNYIIKICLVPGLYGGAVLDKNDNPSVQPDADVFSSRYVKKFVETVTLSFEQHVYLFLRLSRPAH